MNRKTILFFVFIITFTHHLTAQFKHHYTSSNNGMYNEIPESFKIDIESLRDSIFQNAPSYYKTGRYGRINIRFADDNAQYIESKLLDGSVYTDWQSLENYVNEILQKVIPTHLKEKNIHAYLTKSGSFNAGMSSSGFMFINIGVFEELRDEASLAAIMAHEIAHYTQNHSLEDFIKHNLGEYDYGLLDGEMRKEFSIQCEFEADSLAMVWLKNSGYHISGILDVYRILERNQKRTISRIKDKWELKEVTHPSSGRRLDKFSGFYEKNKTYPGEKFLVSQKKFEQFRAEAFSEILFHQIKSLQYNRCIESAFHFHLLDPENPIYIFYLLESIRRLGYSNVDIWKENFIANKYYETYVFNDRKHKRRITRHLFEKMDLNILPVSPKEVSKIKARHYWSGDPKFKTNEEAFEYFYALSQKLNCSECILTYALSITRNIELRNKFLSEYISKNEVQYLEFAQMLLDNRVYNSLGDNKLLVVNDFKVKVKEGEETINLKNDEDLKPQRAIIDSIAKLYPDRKIIFMEDLRKSEIDLYREFLYLEQFIYFTFISKGEKTELHILDPAFLEIFSKYNVNEIEFLNVYLWEKRKKQTSVEEYITTSRETHESVMKNTKTNQTLGVLVVSLREKLNKAMKVRSGNFDGLLKFKPSGYDQIIQQIRISIDEKEEDARKKDLLLIRRNGK